MKLLLVVIALAASLSAVAQSKHMVAVGTDAQTLGSLAWTSEKTRDQSATETKKYFLTANYAYSFTDHLQLGGKVNYSQVKSSNSNEDYGVQVGGIYNLNTDFRKSLYASVYVGWNWGHSTRPNARTEDFTSTVAIGHRYPLSFLNLENVTFSPEIAYVSMNPTKSSNTEWSQSLQFRLVQFAVFF